MPSRVRSFTSRIRSFLMGKAAFKNRGTRRANLEQLEARRVMAAAILDDLSFHKLEANVSSLIRMPEGEGEPNPPQVFFYSPSVPGFVKNSNHSVLFVDDSDVVKLSVFSNSSWTHEIYFDGGDVGLTNSSENVDALSIRADGSLLVSTVGDFRVNGLSADGEDLLLFRPTSLGTHTAGTWEMYFDGSDVGLSSWEGLDGVSELPDGRLILSVGRQAAGLVGTVSPEDLVSFTVSSSGNNTSGTWQRFFDGSDVHLGGPLENLDGVSVDADGTTLNLSTTSLFCVPGLLGFGRDIFTFEATQLGSQTQGTYQSPLTLNGSHRGLLFNSIDAIHVPSATAVNQPPIIAGITSPTIPELAPYQLQLSATDPDTPPTQLVWSLVSGPVGAQLSATTGLFTWSPTEAQGPGVFPVIVALTDGTSTAQATFSISVTEVNQPPVIASIANQTIDESTLLTVQVSASDADLPAQPLTYALGQGAPAGAAISSTGSFTWTPSEADGPGDFTIPIVVTDSLGASATQSFTVTVREVNQPPVIAPITNQTIDESTLLTVQVSASDADLPAQPLTYALVQGAPAGATINSAGSFSWTPGEADGPGVFTVPVIVTDSLGASATQSFTVTVREVNRSPVLGPINDHTLNINQTLSLTAVATDPDLPANTLVYSLTTAPAGATINAQTGLITWLANQNGTVPFTVQVADQGGLTSSQSFQVNVVGIELRELTNFSTEFLQTLTLPNATSALRIDFQTPSFDSTSQNDIRDAFEIELMDLNGNPLVLPYAGGVDASFNWTEGLTPAAAAGVTTTIGGAGSASSASINLSGLAAGTQFQLRLRLVNNDSDNGTLVRITSVDFVGATTPRPEGATFSSQSTPVGSFDFSSIQDVTGNFSVNYGRSTLAATNDRLLVDVQLQNQSSQAYRGPVLLVIKNLSSLDANALRPDGLTPDGSPYFRIGLSDTAIEPGESSLSRQIGFLNTSNERFDFDLQILAATNSAPNVFLSSPLTSIEAGDTYVYAAKAVDPDGDTVSYSIISGPAAAMINEITGALSWNTTTGDIGSQRITIRATDSFGSFLEQTFTVQVFATLQNRPPNFVSEPVTDAIASSGFEISTVATGNQPAGVGVISGFRGPRLVSINAGDQSVSVHAGQNNDRFDDTSVYSTGEPKPTGAVIDVGYTVDVGLPPFLVPNDRNEVMGMDQADFNGDGILDLAVLTARDESNKPTNQRYKIEITRMLGDGDGNFGAPVVIASIPTPNITNATSQAKLLTLADIDGDGRLDVTALQETTPRLVTVRGLGDGSFEPAVFTTLATPLNDYRLVDLDRDGNLDIVGRTTSFVDLGWMRGAGNGTFAPFVRLAVGGGSWGLTSSDHSRSYDFADMDGDGDIDIVNSESNGANIVIWLNDGSENFTVGATIDPPGSGNRGAYVLHVADFSGDGRLDVFTINLNPSVERVELFVRSSTGLSFTQQLSVDVYGLSGNLAGSDRPVDIDGDGDLDIIVANNIDSNPTSPQVLINDGTGRFKRTDFPMADFPGHILATQQTNLDVPRGAMFGDYNRDGVMDFSYMTSSENGGYDFNGVGIRLGTRPGEFGATRTVTDMTLNFNDQEVHAADFNLDGKIDLLTLSNARMSLGNGDGTFRPSFPATSISAGSDNAVVADFNLDGIPDYVATRANGSSAPEKIYVALGNGDGTFAASLGPTAPGMFYHYANIRTADFNNDGYPDLIAKGAVERFIDVYLNNSANPGTFTRPFRAEVEVTGVLTQGFDHTIATGDFDSDGNTDFVTVDQVGGEPFSISGNPLKLQTFSGNGAGNFSVTNESFAFDDAMFTGFNFYYPEVLESGDVNGDGHLDVVSFGRIGFIIHVGDGTGAFTSVDHYPIEYINPFGPKSGFLVDFDEDGHLDLIQHSNNETLSIRRGNGDGTFDEPQRVGTMGFGDVLTFADFDNDSHLDMAVVMSSAGNYNNEDVVFYYGTRRGLVDQLAVDLDGDGNEEVLAVNEANDRLKILTGDNLDRLNRRNDLLTGRAPQAVASGDLNGDGRPEIITANRAGRSISVFRGSLASGYTSSDILVGNAPIDVLTRDINGDGHTDVLVLDEVANAAWVLTGSANGTLSAPVAIALGDKPGKFTVADATGDGQLDAVITLPDSNRLIILPRIGVQPASAPIYVSVTASPSDIQVTDLNADGNPDLATTLPNSDVLSVIYGRGSNQFARAQNISVGDQPTRVTLADADEDGRMDLIVANSGDNTASVIYNRFDPNEVYRYDSDAIDPDSDTLTYSIVDGPGGLIINSQTGALLWAASPDQVGEHTVTISANDGRGGIATQSFNIDVQPARDNALPLIATEPNTKMGAGETFTYQATALDNDRDTLRYSLIDAPAGATIDPTSGKVTWDARADMALSIAPHGINSRGHVEIEAHPSLQPTSLTAEGWYNFTGLPASNGRSNIISSGVTTTTGTTYKLFNFGNASLRLEIDYPSPTGTFTYSIPYVPTANRWTHFAITIDDSTRVAKIYVDGVERGSTTIPSPLIYNPTANAWVGDSTLFFTQAIIDNYRLWNVVRTPTEITEGLSRQYNGDTRLVLDYRFDEPQTLTVRDFSPAGNHGYRTANGLLPAFVPGLAETGSHQFTIGVEDGRGGSDQQSFTLNILPELRSTIRGLAFSDLDGNGSRNGTEPVLAGVHLFIDSNGNGYPDPSESQTTTAANGTYQFSGLLPGQYPVRVSPLAGFETPVPGNVSVSTNANSVVDLALEQLSLGQIRGQLRTEALDPIAYWNVFADLDNDGELDAGEPTTSSDRGGNYALSGINSGAYTIRTELPAGWSVASGTNGQSVTLAANAISTGNNFSLRPTNTSVTGGLHFVTTPTLTLEARQTFRYASVAIGIQSEAIRYDLSLAPVGMSIDPASGLIAWRPTVAQVGEHPLIVRATSASGSISLQDFTLTVTAPNTAPVLTDSMPTTAYVGLVYAVNLAAQDAESQTITYSLLSGPASATLNATSGELRWTPTLADVGSVPFSIELRDSQGGVTVVNVNVQVVNAQPVATPYQISMPRTQIGLGQDYLSQISGQDALGRPLSWTLQSGPAGMVVSANGTLSWTPGNSDLGAQTIVVRATDVDGGNTTRTISLQVVGRPVNSAPIIDSQPLVSTVVGGKYKYDVRVSDSDADPLSYALLDAPIGMSIHPTLGTIRWTPAVDQLGESDVSVQVTDPDGATAMQTYKLKVSRSGGPPAISSVPPTEASVGTGYLYSVVARDSEGDPLTYRLLAAPVGMTIAQTTGVISWTPQAGQVGQQDVVIEVSDGIGGAVTQAFAIRVSTGVPNLPPVISSTAPRFGSVGALYTYTVQATDPESTTITYSLGQSPSGMTIDPVTGVAQWTPTQPFVGKSVVTLIATDAGGGKAVESFELDVVAANSQPTIVSTAPQDAAAGALFTYQVLGRDIDLDQLTYTLTTAPVGSVIDTFGKITWPTTPALIGPHNFAVRVTDPRGGVATQSFTLSVIADVIPPKVSLIENLGDANRNVLPWQGPFVVYARAIDNVAVRSLTLRANGQDIPLDAAGTATFTFEDWGFQSINAIATAVDTNGNITTKTIQFDYDFPEGWGGAGTADIPTVAITSPTDTAAVFGMVTITGTASHANFAGYKLSYRRIDETTYTQFFESTTAVVNGTLGVWDTSLLINDEYVIRLEAATNAGVVNVFEHNVGLSGDLKLGNFQLSFTDMVIPVAGIPVEITRIYDTLQADREGDFGYGWRLEYRNTDLRVGLPKSGLEDIGIYSPLRPGVKVYLNVPGQGRQGFTFNPDIRVLPGLGNNNLVLARPRFTPDPGVTSSLSTGSSNYLQVNEFGELFAPGGIPYNPASPNFGGAYVLKTKEGTTFRIGGSDGKLQSAVDRHGNTLTFTDSGIASDTGLNVQIIRDTQGRITSIIDPANLAVSFNYSASGDLLRATDRNGNQTSYQYSTTRSHFLTEVVDPFGNTGVRGEYNSEGRLISLRDPLGNSVAFTTDLNNNQQLVVDSLGNQTIYGYDNQGNTTLVVDPRGNSTVSSFNSRNELLATTDPLGRTTIFTYDNFGNRLTTTNPQGGITRVVYSNALSGQVSSVTDTLGNNSSYSFDASGNLREYRDSQGVTTQTQVDARGRLSQLVIPAKGATVYTYGNSDTPTSKVDESGNLETFALDALGRVVGRTWIQTVDGVVRTLTESYELDANGNRTKLTDALGNMTLYSYDANNRISSQTDALGRQTRFVYDSRGLLTETIFPDNTPAVLTDSPRLRSSYDALGRVSLTTDELGRVTHFVYDSVGNLTERIFPDDTPLNLSDNPRERQEFDAANQVVATIDANGNRTAFEYDSLGNRVVSRDALGNSTRTEYNSAGRQTRSIDALGQQVRYIYDDSGRISKTIYADGSQVQMTYNPRGLVSSQSNRNGQETQFVHDKLGRVVKVIEANGAVTNYGYDQQGNLVSQTDASGRTTTNSYDELGRQKRVQKPLGEVDLREFDAVGNMVTHTDFNGDRHSYGYDERDRQITKSIVGQSTVTRSFLANGLLASEVDSRGTTTYSYDSRDQLLQQADPTGAVLSYRYDAHGNVTRVSSLAGSTNYAYDALNRIASVTDSENFATEYTYDAASRQVQIEFANGTIESRTYNSSDLVTSIVTSRGATTLDSHSYQYDADGNRLLETDSTGRRVQYTYDNVARLTSESVFNPGSVSADRTTSYTLDNVGNRVVKTDSLSGQTTYSYNNNDELISETNGALVTNYQYDANGNQTRKVTGATTQRYRYSGENRLLGVDTDGNGSDDITYIYDSQGNRVSRTVGANVTRYQVDSNRALPEVLTEYNASSVVIASYTYGNKLISQRLGTQIAYYHADSIGSTQLLTDATGQVLNSYAYDSFGQVTSQTGSFANEFLFAGQRRDPVTGQDYLRARNYDSSTGRFASEDPFTGSQNNPITLQNYVYANANPTRFVDPLGLFSLAEVQIVGPTLIDLQKSFVTSGFDGLKRVGKIADELLEPGVIMQDVGLSLMGSSTPAANYGAHFLVLGVDLYAAGLQAMVIAIGGIYYDTVASLFKLEFSFGPISLSLNALKGEVELVGFGLKKKWSNSPIDILIDQYIDSAQVITESKNVQQFMKGPRDFYQAALKNSTKAATALVERAWELD